jgi:flotillin
VRSWVQLNTLRLEVTRKEGESMITADRMRADISAEFYVRVKPEPASIALAAQTLGDKTNNAEQLKTLIEAKFIDALRSVAATMTLMELQEKRVEFVKKVQDAVAADLQMNGLELESVSLTRLDQTDIKHFNPNNFFDAEGLTALTKTTEARRNERNEITQDTEVKIAEKNREANLTKLRIERENQEAQLNQEQAIAERTSETRANKAKAEQAARTSEEGFRIDAERTVAENEARARQAKETARLAADREVSLTQQQNNIAIAEASQKESEARAKAEDARAIAISATEKVNTAQAEEVAERGRRIEVIAARAVAERQAAGVIVQAQAEKEAAQNRAEALTTEAEAEARAAESRAKGIQFMGEAEATRERLVNEARNTLSPTVIDYELTRERIRIIPEALRETMKAVEHISDIKIISAGGAFGSAGGSATGSLAGGLTNELLSYNAQKPIMDTILKQAGFQPLGTTNDTLLSVAVPGTITSPVAGSRPPATPETSGATAAT